MAGQAAEVRAFVRYNSRGDLGLLADLPRDIQEQLDIVGGDPHDPESVHTVAWTLAAQYRSNDTIIHAAGSSALAFIYYEPKLPNHFLAGDPDYMSETTQGRTGRVAGLTPEDRAGIVKSSSRAWLVVALDHNIDYQRSRRREFDSLYRRAEEQNIGWINLWLYEVGK